MNKQQTAVEILYRAVADRVVMQDETKALICIHISHDDLFKIHRQAKEMEKEQIKSAFNIGEYMAHDYFYGNHECAENYYNETYGGNK
jgi:hypothetical protein